MEKFNFKTMSLFSIYLFNLAGKRLQDIFLKVKMMMKRIIVITGNDNGGTFRNGNERLTSISETFLIRITLCNLIIIYNEWQNDLFRKSFS